MTDFNKESAYLLRPNSEGKTQNIFHTLYTPKGDDVIATLLVLHGMQEHSGRYDEIARYFAERNYAVMTYDHIGHGKTAETREDLGFFQLKKPAEQLVSDAGLMADKLHQLYPDVPHFILGHSMGSFIARALLQEKSKNFEGAVISGTGGRVPGISLVKIWLAILNKLSPRKRSNFVNNTFSKMNNQKFKNEPGADSTAWLSLSKTNREKFKADNLNGIPFSNNGFFALISINKRATEKDWANNIPKDFPMLFVSGAEDPIGDFGKGVRKTVSDLKKSGFNNITAKIYPDMRHEILNEDIREEVFAKIYQWMNGK